MAARLEHVGVVTPPETVDAARQFYADVFGWTTLREGTGVIFIGDGAGGRLELLIQDAAPMAAPNHLAFVIPLDEFDAYVSRIKATGVLMDAPMENPFGRLCFFSDPSGNRAQIVGRSEPMPG